MFPMKSFCGFENNSPVNNLTENDDSIKALSEKKYMEASKSHKEAERRRRQRINAHFSTLRSLLPNTTKTDKASLLAEVVHHVRELKRQVEDVGPHEGDGCCSNSQPELETTTSWPFPGECDESALSFCDKEGKLLKATVCCEDRPGLNLDLSQAIKSVQAKVVRAEMTTVGGRTKSVVVMQWSGGEEQIGQLKRALKDVVENRVSRLAQRTGSKRARVFGSDNESDHGFLVTRKVMEDHFFIVQKEKKKGFLLVQIPQRLDNYWSFICLDKHALDVIVTLSIMPRILGRKKKINWILRDDVGN